MPLSRHAQEEVDKRVKELYEAYSAGYNDGVLGEEATVGEVTPSMDAFKFFLSGNYADLVDYVDPEKLK